MEKTIEIRKAEAKDLDTVFNFICHLEETSFPFKAFEEIFLEQIDHPDHIYVVAVNENDEPIGFISCHGQKLLHHGGWVYEIQELYVARNYRETGIGKRLIEAVEEKIEKTGCKSFEVSTNAKRTDAKRFYAKMGFMASHLKFVK